MPDVLANEFLSFGDALFLYLEREGMPLNVASVCIFEGIVPLDDCRRFIESKLPVIPRYRQRILTPPFNIGFPSWEYDPEFDIRNHVREVSLRRGTEAELKAMAAKVLSANMDRRRPLWDFTMVRGLKGDRTAVIFRVHHSLADGISGVGLMSAIMDLDPAPPQLPNKKPRFHAPPPRDTATVLLDALSHWCLSAVERVLTAHSELLAVAQQAVAAAGKSPQEAEVHPAPGFNSNGAIPSLNELSRLLPEISAPIERLPFNVVCRGPQKFSWAEISLEEIKALKRAGGATVNDVALTVVASAMRRYAELHGVRTRGRSLRIVVPVSLRGRGKVSDLGNRITFVPVVLPLDLRHPGKLLAAIRERMALLKSARVAEFVGLAGTLLGTIPAPLQALAGPIASQLPLSVCNLICTNVPGPRQALHLLGHKMLSCYPYVPIGGEMGMNCAILTYNGVAYFGFTGDVHAIPDLECLPKFLRESFAELQQSFGIRPRRRNSPRRKTTPEAVPAPQSSPPQQEAAPEPAPAPAKPPTASEDQKVFRSAAGA
jgi:diacylglycerol O-acyltransferase